jgi:glycosyltransferase involved in cell wall biosynthesis
LPRFFKTMTRVMMLIDTYRVGGPAKGLLDFCDATRGDLDPLIVVFQRGGQQATEFREACASRGVQVEVLWEQYRFDPSLLAQAQRVAGLFRPELVQTHGYKADIVGLHLRWRLGVPWIAFSHGWTDEGLAIRLYRILNQVIIRRADRIVAVSEARKAALEIEGCPSSRLVTIHNAVEMPHKDFVDTGEIFRQLGLHENRLVVAVVGRLSPEKGQRYFVEAMAEVVRTVPAVLGLVIGDGQEEQRLRAKVQELSLDDTIHFIGYRRDMHRIYSAIELLVLPSLSEGLPNVVLEAMSHGRPVIGTRVGGVPEAVEEGVCGLLVPPGDVAALTQAIVRLLLDPETRQRMGKAARMRAKHSFSVSARAERILALYDEILSTRHVAANGSGIMGRASRLGSLPNQH